MNKLLITPGSILLCLKCFQRSSAMNVSIKCTALKKSSENRDSRNAFLAVFSSRLTPGKVSNFPTFQEHRKKLHLTSTQSLETRGKSYRVTSQLISGGKKPGKIVKVTVVPIGSNICRISKRKENAALKTNVVVKPETSELVNPDIISFTNHNIKPRAYLEIENNSVWPEHLLSKNYNDTVTQSSTCLHEANDDLTPVQKMLKEISAKVAKDTIFTKLSLVRNNKILCDRTCVLIDGRPLETQFQNKVKFEILDTGRIRVLRLMNHDYVFPLEDLSVKSRNVEKKFETKFLVQPVRNELPLKTSSSNRIGSEWKLTEPNATQTVKINDTTEQSKSKKKKNTNAASDLKHLSEPQKNKNPNLSELGLPNSKQTQEKITSCSSILKNPGHNSLGEHNNILETNMRKEGLVTISDPIAKYVNMLRNRQSIKTNVLSEPNNPCGGKKPSTKLKIKIELDAETNNIQFNMLPHPVENVTNKLLKHKNNEEIVRIPINRNNLPTNVDPVLEPHRNVVDVITSIDKSTVVIQKDFYIAEKIIKKIKEDKKPKPKPSSVADGRMNASPGIIESKDPMRPFGDAQSKNELKMETRTPLFRRLNYLNSGKSLTLVDKALPKTSCRLNDIAKLYLNRGLEPAALLGEESAQLNPTGESSYCGNFNIIFKDDETKSGHPLTIEKIDISIEKNDEGNNHFKSPDEIQSSSFGNLVDSSISNMKGTSKPKMQFSQCRQSHLPKSPHSNGGVDLTKRTIITSVKEGENTNIEVHETQSFVDKRLPVPLRIESFFQMFGRTDTLRDHLKVIDDLKGKLEASQLGKPDTRTPVVTIKPEIKPTDKKTSEGNKVVPRDNDVISKSNFRIVPILKESKVVKRKKVTDLINVKQTETKTPADVPLIRASVIISDKIPRELSKAKNLTSHPSTSKSNSNFDNFEEIKVLTGKHFDAYMKQIMSEKQDSSSSTESHAIRDNQKKFDKSSEQRKSPKMNSENQADLNNAKAGLKKRRKKFIVYKKLKTRNYPNNDNHRKSIIESKLGSKKFPPNKPSTAPYYVDLTRNAKAKRRKIEVVEDQPSKKTSEKMGFTKRDEEYIHFLYKNQNKKLKDFREPSQSNEKSTKSVPQEVQIDKPKKSNTLNKSKDVSHVESPPKKTDASSESKSLSVDMPNTTKFRQEDLNSQQKAGQISEMEGERAKLKPKSRPSEVIPQKAEQLKALLSNSSNDSVGFSSTPYTIDIMVQKEKDDVQKKEVLSKAKSKSKNEKTTSESLHIKNEVSHILNKEEIRAFKAEIKARRRLLRDTGDPGLDINLDKVTKEIIPPFDKSKYKKCPVQLEEIPTFPLLNNEKQFRSDPSNKSEVTSISLSSSPNLKETLQSIPSVSRVLNATMPDSSKVALNRWRVNMISRLGENGFENFYRGQLTRGCEFHKCLEDQLSGRKISARSIEPRTKNCLKSVDWVLKQLTDISVVESQVVHSKLGYRGVLDCVAKYRDKPVVIEWKHSDSPKPLLQSTYDAPVQLSAYLGALNFDTNYDFQVDRGILVIAYSNGSRADVFEITQELSNQYWKIWLTRLQQYLMQSSLRELK